MFRVAKLFTLLALVINPYYADASDLRHWISVAPLTGYNTLTGVPVPATFFSYPTRTNLSASAQMKRLSPSGVLVGLAASREARFYGESYGDPDRQYDELSLRVGYGNVGRHVGWSIESVVAVVHWERGGPETYCPADFCRYLIHSFTQPGLPIEFAGYFPISSRFAFVPSVFGMLTEEKVIAGIHLSLAWGDFQ